MGYFIGSLSRKRDGPFAMISCVYFEETSFEKFWKIRGNALLLMQILPKICNVEKNLGGEDFEIEARRWKANKKGQKIIAIDTTTSFVLLPLSGGPNIYNFQTLTFKNLIVDLRN